MNLTTSQLMFHKDSRSLTAEMSELGLRRFPNVIDVTSDHTNRTVRFEVNEDEWIDAEGWDGMMMVYRPVEPLDRVTNLTLIND